MDRIELEGMVFSGRHGVRPAERAEPQEFRVDVKVDADLSEAGLSDRVATVSVRVAKRPQSMRPIDAAAVKIKRTRA